MPSTSARPSAAYPVAFFDGRTATRHDAVLRLAGARLLVATPDGISLADWPLAAVSARSDNGPDLHLARSDRDDGARIVVGGTVARTVVFEALPQGGRPRRLSLSAGRVLLVVCGVVAALVVAYLLAPPAARAVARLVPPAWVAPIGRQMVEGVAPADRRCDGTPGAAALAALTARLTEGSAIPPITVHVADLDLVNAFALPGGQVILTRGLLETAQSAEAVAGVLAHEIGHVAERHPTAAMARRVLGQLVLELFGGGFVAEGTTVLAELSYSRDDERTADAVAVSLLNRANIDGAGLAGFMKRLAQREADGEIGSIPGFLSTHPESDGRAEAIADAAMGVGPALTVEAWNAVRRTCGDRGPSADDGSS